MTSAAASTTSTTDTIQVRSWRSDFSSSTFTVSLLSGLAIGLIVAGNVAAPGSTLFYSCIGTGGVAGGLAGPLVEKCIAAVKYPARQYRQALILNQSFTNESESVIDDIVTSDFQEKSWFKEWRRDKEVLPNLCEHGVCYGVLATLERLMQDHHLSSVELHALLHTPENRRSVLKHQCFEFILADLDNRVNTYLSCIGTISEAKKDVGYLAKTAISLNLFSEESFIASLPKNLSNAYGIITFGKEKWGHGFFVQFDDHFRFCDTYNAETGLYEFPTQELLLHYLYKQLWSYEPITDVALYLYSFEQIDK